MTTKTTGYEFKKFYVDPKGWPGGVYHDYEEISVGGVYDHKWIDDYSGIPDEAKVEISGGLIFNGDGKTIGRFETEFRRWRRLQSCTTIFVECPNGKIEAIKAAISAAGGRVGK